MISILEPNADQALTGSRLYCRAVSAASGGAVVRRAWDAGCGAAEDPEEVQLVDGDLIGEEGIVERLVQRRTGLLLHAMPFRESNSSEALSAARFIVATNRDVLGRIQAALPDKHVSLCEPGIDSRLRTLRPQPREHESLRMITVANFEARKGLRDACDLLASLDASGVRWHWYLVGQPLRDRRAFAELIAIFESRGWDENVTMVGSLKMEQQLRLYLNMDVALFPSREGFGSALLEAYALGLPILATPIGVAEEILTGDPDALVAPAPWTPSADSPLLEFLTRYSGRVETVRSARVHPRMERSWARVAGELVGTAVNAGILWD